MSTAKQTQSRSTVKNLLAGGIAGGVEACIMFPTEYVKTQLQLQARGLTPGQPLKYSGVFDCAYKIVKERGPLALYKGVSTLIVVSRQAVQPQLSASALHG